MRKPWWQRPAPVVGESDPKFNGKHIVILNVINQNYSKINVTSFVTEVNDLNVLNKVITNTSNDDKKNSSEFKMQYSNLIK